MCYTIYFLLLAAAYNVTFTQLVTTTVLLVDYPIAIRYLFGPLYYYHYYYIVLNTIQ